MGKRLFLVVLVWLLQARVHAQLPDSLLENRSSIGFRYENDFFTATDRYYTQGIKLEFAHKLWRKSPFSKLLIRNKEEGIHQYGISVEQNCFTPRSIRVDTIYVGERPYAAVAMLSHFARITFLKKLQRLETRLDLGVLGPCAMCEEEQKGIHHALNNIQPLGWEYQLATDYIINYSITYDFWYGKGRNIDVMYSAQLRAGSLYNDASASVHMRFGRLLPLFESKKPEKAFYAFFFWKNTLRGVVYNATLQGGMFNRSSIYTLESNLITRAVLYSNLGVTLRYKKFSLDYSYTLLTNEFKTGLPHAWGGLRFYLDF
ncbi:MAG: lipid A deacylase LpxR family protein [Flavobacteriales bacterium]